MVVEEGGEVFLFGEGERRNGEEEVRSVQVLTV